MGMQHNSQYPSTDLADLDVLRRGFKSPQYLLDLTSFQCCPRVTNQLCAGCKDKKFIHKPLPVHGALLDSHLPGYGAHLGRHPVAHGAPYKAGTSPGQLQEFLWASPSQDLGATWAGTPAGLHTHVEPYT